MKGYCFDVVARGCIQFINGFLVSPVPDHFWIFGKCFCKRETYIAEAYDTDRFIEKCF
jgi:hypothetical protein